MIEWADTKLSLGDLQAAKSAYAKLVQENPGNKSLIEKATGIDFQLRLSTIDDAGESDIDIMDGPVTVTMNQEETVAALSFLGFKTLEQMRTLFTSFESLGYSCEFGLVQRRFGAEPIGLLRWNSVQYLRLVAALDERFSAFDNPGNIFLVEAGREYILRDREYNTSMHTFHYINEVQPENLLAQQQKRTAFLKRKLLSDLELGEKIFVYLDNSPGSVDGGHQLLLSIRKYSRASVLYVTTTPRVSQVGTVEDRGDGLLRGYISKLGREADGSWNIAFSDWLNVCKEAKNYHRVPENA